MTTNINIKSLLKESLDDFMNSSSSPLDNMPKISLLEKKKNEREARKVIGNLQETLLSLNILNRKKLSHQEKDKFQEAIMEFMDEADRKEIFFDDTFFTYFVNQGYLKSTEDFFAFVKLKDQEMPLINFFQALRNIFIANSLQLLFDHPVKLNEGLANYSLLYPYTDNYLDDSSIPSEEKRAFNKRFLLWLEGNYVLAKNSNEEKVRQAVISIKGAYPKEDYRLVHESLLHIYDAQVSSMSQEGSVKLSPQLLLPISFFKGGASVVADACLSEEKISPAMIHFAFVYGTFLQLIDDLQDYKEDREQNHWTLFSVKNKEEIHDLEISKLISYLFSAMHKIEFHTPHEEKLKSFILNACLMMIFSVVGKSPYLVSSHFYKALENISRFRLPFYSEIEKSFHKFNTDSISELTLGEINLLD